MFNPHDIIVYPGYGVARINREVEKIISGSIIKLYELQFMNKDVTILVPVGGMFSVGIRQPSTKEEILALFEIFCIQLTPDSIAELSLSSWNRRSKEYQNKIRTGSVQELAVIYRDLKTIERYKSLSFGEKAVMHQVEALISEECAVVERRSAEEVAKEIRMCCEACINGLSHTLSHFLSFNLPINIPKSHVQFK